MNMKLQSILITGASSGIGHALALRLAKPNVFLYLAGRRQEALKRVADECMKQGAIVEIKIVDVCDQQAMENWISSIGSLDLVLACAGISTAPQLEEKKRLIFEPSQKARQIMATNVKGVLNTVLPALEIMQKQGLNDENIRGRIVAIASIAGFFTSAWAPSYCASKAAVDRFMVASGAGWKRQGILLASVCCGFVDTPMTLKNNFYMPGKISADQAAQLILRGIEKRKRRIVFPIWLAVLVRIIDLLPVTWLEKLYLPYLEAQK